MIDDGGSTDDDDDNNFSIDWLQPPPDGAPGGRNSNNNANLSPGGNGTQKRSNSRRSKQIIEVLTDEERRTRYFTSVHITKTLISFDLKPKDKKPNQYQSNPCLIRITLGKNWSDSIKRRFLCSEICNVLLQKAADYIIRPWSNSVAGCRSCEIFLCHTV